MHTTLTVDYVSIAVAAFFSNVEYMLNISRFTRSYPKLYRVILILWALFGVIGLFFCAVFIGMQFDVFRITGATSDRNTTLGINSTESSPKQRNSEILCLINSLDSFAPDTARAISETYTDTQDAKLIILMIETASQRFITDPAYTDATKQCATNPASASTTPPRKSTAYAWADSPEWATLTTALRRDRAVILRVSDELDISPRLIIAGVIGEQFRFFTGLRTAFKNYFEPLKIFGRLSKFSYGIAGLKPDTVRTIERNLHNTKSPFYIGPKYTQLITYSSRELAQHNDPQLARITDTASNYYSYLYVGLYMKQVIAQWDHAGYDISGNPGVLATLYNLGFNRSIPKADPKPGGAPITVNNTPYTFGQIGEEFYYSGELVHEFPYTAVK